MEGSCLCGETGFAVSGTPELSLICHCTHCRKQTGSAFSLLYAFPREQVRITGNPKSYRDTGDSGKSVDRLFCATCGSSIAADAAAVPHLLFVHGGALPADIDIAPERQIFCASAFDWAELPGLDSFARLPHEADL